MNVSPVDEEKPFLEHLDDLRSMLIRMVVCILISTLICLCFSQKLMDIIRYPADQVWGMYETSHLPKEVSTDDWADAKALAYALPGLNAPAVENLKKHYTPQVRTLSDCVLLMRAAHLLPEDQRAAYYEQSTDSSEVRRLLAELEEHGAVLTEGTGRGALQMMGAFQPGESFFLSMKLGFYAGIVISFPCLLFFLLQFIVPGLLERERKLLYKCLAVGCFLFLMGVAFAYWIVLPRVLMFFYEYSLDFGIANEWRIGYYVSFATQMVFLFGAAFELPVVLMPFIKLGVLNYKLMSSTRSYAILGIAILAAVITPTPDAVTMLLMALPMYALYEICILIAWREERSRAKRHEEEERLAEEVYGLPTEDGV